MKRFCVAVAIMLPLSAGWISVTAKERVRDPDTLFQVSTLGSLLAGDYDGKASFREVKRRGNFGLGTFAALDGEMVAVDGEFFQIRDDGTAKPVSNDRLTPFAAVTFFKADDAFHISGATSCAELHEQLQNRFPSNQLLYAIKASGHFTQLTTRSVPAQEKPYVSLADALKQQVVFDFDQIDATLVGFWLPAVLGDVNVAGFHFHAITADAMAGGHVLDCEVWDVEVEIDYTNELKVQFADKERPHRSRPKPGHRESRHHGAPPLQHW